MPEYEPQRMFYIEIKTMGFQYKQSFKSYSDLDLDWTMPKVA